MKRAGNIFAAVTGLAIVAGIVFAAVAISGAFSSKADPAKHFRVGVDVGARVVPIEVKAKGAIVETKRDAGMRCDLWADRELCFDGNGVLQYNGPVR
jgi:hypothetical protein